MKRIPMTTGDEFDALTRWRRFLRWPAGVRAAIKRGYRRRERRHLRQQLREEYPVTAYSSKRLADQVRAYLRSRVDYSAGEQTIIAALRDTKIAPGDISAALREMRQRDELYFDGPPERRRYKLPPEPERLPDETPRPTGEPEYTPPVEPAPAQAVEAPAEPSRIAQARALLAERGPLHVSAIGAALGLSPEVTANNLRKQLDAEVTRRRMTRASGVYGLAEPGDASTTPPTPAAPGLDDLALQIAEHARGLLAEALRERDGRIKLMEADIAGQSELSRQAQQNLDRALKAEARVAELEHALTKAEAAAEQARAEVAEIRALGRKLFGGA